MSTVYSLTPATLETLVSQIFSKTDDKITASTVDFLKATLVNTLNETVTEDQVPTAKAVYDMLSSLSPKLDTKLVIGNIEDVENPETTTIYINKDSEDDPTGIIYLYSNDEWIKIGDTDIDLSGYVTTEALEEYKTTVTEALESKANVSDLTALESQVETLSETALTEGETTKAYIITLLEDEDVKAALVGALADEFVKNSDVTDVTDEDITNAINKATSEEPSEE